MNKEWLSRLIPDSIYLRRLYRKSLGQPLHLFRPKTFNEKLQWLKIHERKPLYTQMVDKCDAKKYVADIIGEEHIIPTLGVYDCFNEIDIAALPDRFAIKTTHDSGGVVLCKNKKSFDFSLAKRKIEQSLQKNFYWSMREWPYKNVKPRIIVEQFIDDHGNDIIDYKIHVFNGKPQIILVCKDRFSPYGMTEDFFTTEWEHLNVRRIDHPNSSKAIDRPRQLEEMLHYAKLLSENTTFLRTDFYILDDHIYFGELTFFPASGLQPFVPQAFDYEMGEMLKIR